MIPGSRRLLGAALAALVSAWPVADASARAGREPPAIDAPAGILVDGSTGDVLTAKAPRDERPIASATKLMTALLVLERAELDDTFTAPAYDAAPVESQIDLERGERLTVRDLLTALLLESANDAAVTLAAGVSGSQAEFVSAMNDRAGELDLTDTHFANPIGLDDRDNYSSARDLATLTARLLEDETFAKTVDRPRAVLESGSRRRVVENRNRLVGEYPEVDGVKTGHTSSAGYVLVGAARTRHAEVISVVLGAATEDARDEISRELLDYGIDQFHREPVLYAGRAIATAEVRYGEEAALTTPDDVAITVRRGGGAVETRVDAPAELEGPIAANRRVGSIDVIYADEVVERVPLVTAGAVPAPGVLDRVGAALGGGLTWIVACAIVAAVALALIRRRSASRRT